MTAAVDQLLALTAETSSDKRRELLRGVTDIFLAQPDSGRLKTGEMFDGLLCGLAAEMETEVRAELAKTLSPQRHAPSGFMGRLAADEIGVASPVLARCRSLTEADLLHVVKTRGQEHLRLVSSRDDLTEKITDTVVERGDDATVNVLLKNADAPLSRTSAERVVDRAQTSPTLHAAVVARQSLPVDLLNEMYFVVEGRLREEIMRKNAALDPAAVEAALAKGRARVAARDGALPPDYDEAVAHVEGLAKAGPIPPAMLAGFLRHGQRTCFLAALARSADLDFSTVCRVVERQDLDALLIACRAAGYDRALFMTVAALIGDGGRGGMGQVEAYGRRYDQLTADTARRTLRFWRMRASAGEHAAAA